MRWLRPEPGYGKGKGQSITITRILKLPLAGRVSETDRLPSGSPAISTKSLTVSEWGFKMEITQFERNLTYFDITNQYQRNLRDQMSLTMDVMAADALKTTPVKFIPVTTGGVFDTDGTPSTTADKNLTIADLRAIYDYLRETLKAPPFRGGRYIGILSTKAARGIKNDPEFKDWLAPTSSRQLSTNTQTLPVIEGISLFETNHTDTLSGSLGTGGVLGEAVFFGDDGGFLAVIQEPELRAGIPEDLGRFRQIGWVGTLEAGLTWEVAAQARVVHVTSA
jgi:N4-gp56 family major capsid protein